MNNTKPYLIRAIYEWCLDSNYTPHIAVNVYPDLQVPDEYVEDGIVILNLSNDAAKDLVLGNDFVQLMARFNGIAKKIQIPMAAIVGIFAKEINQGLTFAPDPESENGRETGRPQKKVRKRSSAKRNHLQVIK